MSEQHTDRDDIKSQAFDCDYTPPASERIDLESSIGTDYAKGSYWVPL